MVLFYHSDDIRSVFFNLFGVRTPKNFVKCFCTPRPIEQTPTKLPVNIQSNNEIKHNVACYPCIVISHNIVHNKTNSKPISAKPILLEQTRRYLLRRSNSFL